MPRLNRRKYKGQIAFASLFGFGTSDSFLCQWAKRRRAICQGEADCDTRAECRRERFTTEAQRAFNRAKIIAFVIARLLSEVENFFGHGRCWSHLMASFTSRCRFRKPAHYPWSCFTYELGGWSGIGGKILAEDSVPPVAMKPNAFAPSAFVYNVHATLHQSGNALATDPDALEVRMYPRTAIPAETTRNISMIRCAKLRS